MTPVESLYEIREAVLALQRYLLSKDDVVPRRAQIRYEEWVDRFFRENELFIAPQQRYACLSDLGYFLSLIEAAEAYYSA